MELTIPVLGIIDDAYFRHATDIGFTGPDKGAGGKYLFVGPGYKGEIPEGYIEIISKINPPPMLFSRGWGK